MSTLNSEARAIRPIKTLRDKRLAFLVSLEKGYQELGYPTKLNGRDNILEVYEKGVSVPKNAKEIREDEETAIIEKWIN